MGRLLNSGFYAKKKKSSFDDMRKRHRDADCKYRSKVQYLYFKIKSLVRKKTAKDGLLDNALGFIQDLENQITESYGLYHLENCKKKFLNFLAEEELIWKKEKDVTKWWTKVEDLLNKDRPLNLTVKKELEDDRQYSKSAKHSHPRKNSFSLENLNKKGMSYYCVDENIPMLPSYNEEFVNMYANTTVRNKDVFSSSWNVPEVTKLRSFVSNNQGDSACEETLSNYSISSNSDDIFSADLPTEISCAPVPVNNSTIDAMEYSHQAHSSVLHL